MCESVVFVRPTMLRNEIESESTMDYYEHRHSKDTSARDIPYYSNSYLYQTIFAYKSFSAFCRLHRHVFNSSSFFTFYSFSTRLFPLSFSSILLYECRMSNVVMRTRKRAWSIPKREMEVTRTHSVVIGGGKRSYSYIAVIVWRTSTMYDLVYAHWK